MMITVLDNQTIQSTAANNLLSVILSEKKVCKIITDEDDFKSEYCDYLQFQDEVSFTNCSENN